MFHMQFTYFLKLTVRLSLQLFFLVSLERPLRRVLPYCTSSPVYIVNICSENNFALYTFDSDYPDTSLESMYSRQARSDCTYFSEYYFQKPSYAYC